MNGRIMHITPCEDLIEHETAGDTCVCGPDVQYLEGGGSLIIHHALDDREAKEKSDG